MNYRQISVHWVPRILHVDQKTERAEICHTFDWVRRGKVRFILLVKNRGRTTSLLKLSSQVWSGVQKMKPRPKSP